MADISKITLPSGDTYDIKDASATHGMFFASYGNTTYAQVLAAYQAKEVVYCKASSGSNPASGSQTRLAFLAYVNNSENPTNFEFQYYRSVSSHTATQQGDQVYVYNLNSTSGWSVIVREAYSKVVAGTNLESSYSNSAITLNHSASGVTAASKGDASDQTPGFGDTFKALSGTVDAQGHLTAFEEHTVTVPNSIATTNASGLMSSTDKETLDELSDNTVYTETVSNRDIVTIQNGSNCAVSSLKVNIDAVQSGSGDPSSSNIRPISGWSGVDIRQAQENLWGGEEMMNDIKAVVVSSSTGTAANNVRYIQYSPSSTSMPDSSLLINGKYTRGNVKFKENTQYTFVISAQKNSYTSVGLMVGYTDGTYESVPALDTTGVKRTVTYVTTAGKTVRYLENTLPSGTVTLYVDQWGIFEGIYNPEVSAFKQYVGKSTVIKWPEVGTIYGGVLDVTKGELTVTHGQIESYDGEMLPGSWISDRDAPTSVTYTDITSGLTIVTGGTSSTVGSTINLTDSDRWQRTSFVPIPGQVYRITVSKCQDPQSWSYITPVDNQNIALDNTLTSYTLPEAGEIFSKCIAFDSSVAMVYVKSANGGTLTVEMVNNGTPTTGAQVVYELETPVVYKIAPTQITMYDGLNTLWANTGSIQELVYGRDKYDALAELAEAAESPDTTYALSLRGNTIVLFPTTVVDRSAYVQKQFAYTQYRSVNDGVYKSNSSYPYIWGYNGFLTTSNKNIAWTVTMGSDDYMYRVLFYTSSSASNYVGYTEWIEGSKVTCYNGIYNGIEYNSLAFNIKKTDATYTAADYAECRAAFSIIRNQKTFGTSTSIDLPVYDGTVVTS